MDLTLLRRQIDELDEAIEIEIAQKHRREEEVARLEALNDASVDRIAALKAARSTFSTALDQLESLGALNDDEKRSRAFVKERVLELLGACEEGEGLTVQEIFTRAPGLAQQSVRSFLSNAKGGIVEQNGRRWRLIK